MVRPIRIGVWWKRPANWQEPIGGVQLLDSDFYSLLTFDEPRELVHYLLRFGACYNHPSDGIERIDHIR